MPGDGRAYARFAVMYQHADEEWVEQSPLPMEKEWAIRKEYL